MTAQKGRVWLIFTVPHNNFYRYGVALGAYIRAGSARKTAYKSLRPTENLRLAVRATLLRRSEARSCPLSSSSGSPMCGTADASHQGTSTDKIATPAARSDLWGYTPPLRYAQFGDDCRSTTLSCSRRETMIFGRILCLERLP